MLFIAFAFVFGARATFGEPPQVSPAVITQVAVYHPGQKTLVRVEATGPLDCRITRLSDPERVVLDFQGARLVKRYSTISSPFSPVLAIRTGQFRSDLARVVIDLERGVEYHVGSEENSVTVEFDVAASTPVPATSSVPVLVPARAHPAETSASVPPPLAAAGSMHQPGTNASVPPAIVSASSASQPDSSIRQPLPPVSGVALENQAVPFEGTFQDGMLTFRAQKQSLRSVLKRIGDGTGVSIYLADGLGNEQISVEFQRYRLDEALRHILSRYDVFFLYSERQDVLSFPPLRAVWVYPPGRAQAAHISPEIIAAPAQQAAPVQTGSTPGSQAVTPAGPNGTTDSADVLQALKNPSEEVRGRALSQAVLARVQIPQETLIDLVLTDPSSKIRILALRALPVAPDLGWVAERAAGDSNQEVAQAAREILRTLDQRERTKSWVAHTAKPPQQ